MAGERYVALGLGHVRSDWFSELSRWATSAAVPVEFVKTVSVEEVRARLDSGRAFSALLVDARVPGLDRDLVDRSREAGCSVIVVDDGRVVRDWPALGVSAVLRDGFGRDDLLDVLEAHAVMIGRGDDLPGPAAPADNVVSAWRGRLVAVTGPGGTGASTVAMALAQALGDDPRFAEMVVLADLALDADLAMLHDAREVVPGVQELVEAHRSAVLTPEEVRALTFAVTERRYHLLLGLRRHRDWTALRPRAFEAAVDGLRRAFRMVVCDVDPDVEGEDQCGSVDVEERNLMARTITARADVVLVVGAPGLKGLHSMVRIIGSLQGHGVEPARIVPVVDRAPRQPRARAEISKALAELVGRDHALAGPVFVPERRRLDEILRDGARLPDQLGAALTGAVHAVLDRTEGPVAASEPEPVVVVPGELGSWTDEETAG